MVELGIPSTTHITCAKINWIGLDLIWFLKSNQLDIQKLKLKDLNLSQMIFFLKIDSI